ncbi:MAG TPA: DNA recombination protein RmuC [Bacteroidetes bacterium]|nr:DNA recombination protein RmuC [Bacteroidota bacterium]
MPDTAVLIALLLLGLVAGFLIGWLLAKLKFADRYLSDEEISEKYISREIYQSIENQCNSYKKQLKEKGEDQRALEKSLAVRERDILYLEEKLINWKKDFDKLQNRAHTEFENIANRILEEKSQRFTAHNEKKINDLLQPLRENIKDFGKDIERRFTDEAKDKISLKKEIEQLRDLNMQLSSDAQLLASALKGDSKIQGDWGELQLELLLEKAGLLKGTHYKVQPSFKDENGRDKRPDFIINLPEGKHLIVDSKVSLTAYEKYFNAKEGHKREKYLRAHMDSLRGHIKDLSSKKYHHLYQINSPDYMLLFVPIEPAFSVAVQHDAKLFLDALDKNIVIVTNSTLLATMRTVSYIWRQEKQKKNVLEIARQSGLLYDKFVGFIDDLKEIGNKLNAAQSAWDGAMNKLSDSKKYGDTLIGRAEKIKKLGAKASKDLPQELLDAG